MQLHVARICYSIFIADPRWALQPSHACRSAHTRVSVGSRTRPVGTLERIRAFLNHFSFDYTTI